MFITQSFAINCRLQTKAPVIIIFLWEFTIPKYLLMLAGWVLCLWLTEVPAWWCATTTTLWGWSLDAAGSEGIEDWKKPTQCENRCVSFSIEISLCAIFMIPRDANNYNMYSKLSVRHVALWPVLHYWLNVHLWCMWMDERWGLRVAREIIKYVENTTTFA